MSEEQAANKYLEVYKPNNDSGVITKDEFDEWRESKRKSIQREAQAIMRDEDEALGFLIDAGWRRQSDKKEYKDIVPDSVGLIPPYYNLVGYDTLHEAVLLELTAKEYWRFRQNRMEEKAKNGTTRNCITNRG